MDNVLVKFTAEEAGLNEINISLQENVKQQKILIAAMSELTSTSKRLDDSFKTVGASTTKASESQDNMSSSVRTTDAAIVESIKKIDAYKTQISGLESQIAKISESESNHKNKIAELAKQIDVLNAKINETKSTHTSTTTTVEGLSKAQRNLSLSMAQVSSELPNAAMGAQIFFMSISNNIPAVSDAIKQLKQENIALAESGKPTQSVLKSITSTLFSFETAMGLGIAGMVAFGPQIVKWVEGLFKGEAQVKQLDSATQILTKTMESGGGVYGKAVVDIEKVESAMKGYQSGMISGEKFTKIYNDTLEGTFGKAKNAGEAIQLISDKKEPYLDAMKNMSMANALFDASAKDMAKTLEIQLNSNSNILGKNAEVYKKAISEVQDNINKYGDMAGLNIYRYVNGQRIIATSNTEMIQKISEAYNKAAQEERTKQLKEINKHQEDITALASKYNIKAQSEAEKAGINLQKTNEKQNDYELKLQDYLNKLKAENMQKGADRDEAILRAEYDNRIAAIKGNSETANAVRMELEEQFQIKLKELQEKNYNVFEDEAVKKTKAEKKSQTEIAKMMSDAAKDIKKTSEDITTAEEKELRKRQQAEEKLAQIKGYLANEALKTFDDLASYMMDGDASRIQQQLDNLSKYYTTDAEEAAKNKNLKLITEVEYNKKQQALEKQKKDAEKQSKRANILFSSSETIAKIVFKALETQAAAVLNPFLAPLIPFIWAQIPLVGVQTALQLANVNKYWKGRKGGSGEMAMVGEQGPELMWVPDGAAILPAHKSQRVSEAFDIMREYNIPAINPNIPALPNPFISKDDKPKGDYIDYDKIGQAVAKHVKIPGNKNVSINVDGSMVSVNDGNTTTIYRNRKYLGHV